MIRAMAMIRIDGEVLVGRLRSLRQINIVQASAIMKCGGIQSATMVRVMALIRIDGEVLVGRLQSL